MLGGYQVAEGTAYVQVKLLITQVHSIRKEINATILKAIWLWI